jgi:N-methylhydantoinase B
MRNSEPLPSKAEGTLEPGDTLRIETPGGGAHG